MPEPTNAPAQPTTPAPETPPGGGQQPAAQPVKTFTQEELNRVIDERLKREREKYADYEELKKKVADAESAQKSETEKLVEKATKAEAHAREVESQTTERLIRAEAKAIAAELGFTKPDRAIRLADLSQAKVDEGGEVSGVKEALEALAKEMPELLKKSQPPSSNPTNPPKGGDQSGETREQKRARLFGGGG